MRVLDFLQEIYSLKRIISMANQGPKSIFIYLCQNIIKNVSCKIEEDHFYRYALSHESEIYRNDDLRFITRGT